MFGMALVAMLVALDQTIVGTAMPRVIAELNGFGVQLLLLTQEQRLRDDIGVLYEHLKPELFRIELGTPVEGTLVTKTSDALADKRINSFCESAAVQLRVAGAVVNSAKIGLNLVGHR